MGVEIRVGPKFTVIIPDAIRKKIPLAPRQKVLIEEINGVIFILPRPTSFTEFMIGLGKNAWEKAGPQKGT